MLSGAVEAIHNAIVVMNRAKAFFLGILRIAATILLVIIGVVAIGLGGYAVWHTRQVAKNGPLGEPKAWPPIQIEALGGVELNLSTMWRDNQLHYRFSVTGYSDALSNARDAATEQSPLSLSPEFVLVFLDRDGFKAFEHRIPLRQMARIVDSKGEGAGLHANDEAYLDAAVYRRASSWNAFWNFGTHLPRAELKPPREGRTFKGPANGTSKTIWRDLSLWRRLERGMSKPDVRRILGEPTKIDEFGVMTTWYYGHPLGGSVTFDSHGSLESWSEP